MDYDKFAKDKKGCYTSENGFLFWKLSGNDTFVPCFFEGDESNIDAHILVYEGELNAIYAGSAYTLTAGSFSTFLDHPQLRLLSASSDIGAYIMVCKDQYSKRMLKNNPPIPFSYVLKTRQNPITKSNPELFGLLRLRMDNILKACMDINNLFRDKMIKCNIWMLLMDIADKHIRSGGNKDKADTPSRTMELFVSFMKLLPIYVSKEHFSDFYANKLCVTPQYLNRVVKSVSGRTVSGWINFTLVGEITKRLEYTDDLMQKIATDFGFPDQATLTKFYKRETGYSLTEYKKNSGK